MLQKVVPILPAHNIRATIDFYESKLGFTGTNLGNYAIIKSGFAEIHFCLITDINKMHPAGCFIYTDNVEDLFTVFAGKDLLYPPGQMADMKFGKKEFSIKDNNGNMIRFGQQR
jgi:catechol 2,3-dioxygenase-like lactoylglutathione lyase family enzyme